MEVDASNPGTIEYYEPIHLFVIKLSADIVTTPPDVVLGSSRIFILNKLNIAETWWNLDIKTKIFNN